MTNYNCVRGVFIWIDIIQPSVHLYRPLSLRAKRGNLPETKCRPHIRAGQLTYTVKVLSLRGAQRATWQSPGREDGRSVHEQIPFSRGISPLRSDYRPHSGRNDIINQTYMFVISSVIEKSPATEMITNIHHYLKYSLTVLKPSPLRARRGGVKHRKNSPQVTVFSQSGEVAMLQAVRWQRRGNLPEGKCRKRTRASQLARGGSPPSEANRVADEGNRTL